MLRDDTKALGLTPGHYNQFAAIMQPTVVVNRRAADRARAGHPWIYASDVLTVDAQPGDLVRVVNDRERSIGVAFWSSTSQIALRLLGPRLDGDEHAWFRDRLGAAVQYRNTIAPGVSALRLVHGEADQLPALIVDRYGDYLVVQTLTQGMERRLALITELLMGML